ncbi:MAG: glycosyltransferase family 4 protein, partial [Candidatus Omnitrophota bacterium]
DHIVCVNEHIRKNLVDKYGIPEAKIDEVGNGVDCDWFSPAQGLKESNAEEVVITYVGRLENRKNVDLLVRAAALLDGQDTGFKLRIIGEGEEEKRLRNLAISLGLEKRTEFLGRREGKDLLELYRTSSIFVLPSRYEGLPLVLLEAQACGLPAVVTAFSGAEKIIKGGDNGYITKGWEASDLAACIKPLIEDEGLRLSMSENARKHMVEEYSWNKIADRLLEIFEKVRRSVQ